MASVFIADRYRPRHLKVADLDLALAFYHGVLGFDVTQRMPGAAFLSAGGYHHHIGLNTWDSAGGPPPPGRTGLFHLAIRYPTRAELSDALARLAAHRIPLDGASDHGAARHSTSRIPTATAWSCTGIASRTPGREPIWDAAAGHRTARSGSLRAAAA